MTNRHRANLETLLSEGRMSCLIQRRTVLNDIVNLFLDNDRKRKLKKRIHELYPVMVEETFESVEETLDTESSDESEVPEVFSVREDLMTVSYRVDFISLANHKYSRRMNGKQSQ